MLKYCAGSISCLVAAFAVLASTTVLTVSIASAAAIEEPGGGAPQLASFGAAARASVPDVREGTGYDYDPWESINEKTFWFNHDVVDHYALKPAATGWSTVVPYRAREGLANALDNVAMPRRLANKLLQGRMEGAVIEVARFLLNSTFGLAGLFDVGARVGLAKSDADTGQTLGVYGVEPGPYVVVPFMLPMTVRDGIGKLVDTLLDPLSYVAPLVANIGMGGSSAVNERAQNLKLFDDVEETTLDLYGAVRNGYLQRRRASVARALDER